MIENNNTANPTLTFDQLQAIDVAQKTLANLQSEITNAQKILRGTKLESDRAVKDKAYQEELLATSTTQAEAKTKELADLNTNITERTAVLNELVSQVKEHTDLMSTAQVKHDEREAKISQKEKQLSEQGSALGREKILHENDKVIFNSKVAKLKEVISTF